MSPPGKPSSRRPPHPARIVVIGSVNMDLVVQTPRLPMPGETVSGSGFETLPGGKGANQAVAVARLGGRSIFVGRVGDDAFGSRLRTNLKSEKVDVRHLHPVSGVSSGVAAIAVEDSGQNHITVVPGANARLLPNDLRKLESLIAGADAVLCQLEIPLSTVATALRIAKKHGVFTVLDAAPIPAGGLPDSLRGVDLLSPNQTETALITGLPCSNTDQAAVAARRMIEQFDAGLVVIKLGASGALADAGVGKPLTAPAFRVRPVDTTAAGDAFTAALTLRLAEGADLETALRFANAAGALATTRKGAQSAMPTRAAVERLLRRRKEPSSP